jgi:WD40 repeat protein
VRIFRGHKAPHRGVAYLPDGSGFVSASRDGDVKVWDLASGRPQAEYRLPWPSWLSATRVTKLDCLAVAPSGAVVAAGGYRVALWELRTGLGLRTDVDVPDRIHAQRLAFTPDGKHLVAGMFALVENSGLWAWDVASGRRAFTWCRMPGGVWALAVAPGGGRWAVASPPAEVSVLDTRTGVPVWRWSPPWEGLANALAYSPDGRRLALASKQFVYVFDAEGGELLAQWQTHEKHHVGALAFSPDGRLLATGANDRTVKFWRMTELAEDGPPQCAAYDWGLGKVRAVAFAPDGMTAAAVGDNRKVVLWDVDETA